ncbi:AAA family ATPase [Chromobacterium phragmitis]|uniref:AAA family ATPase n=1 Tax=Chromobacterium phragmitis TaxID=2202141 RepID=A0A344UIT7_9NEIS|nr:AAA family ATPase [Chromobacterium phragmitis]AXE35185.1 metal-dependent phosphohydrolase [Chromobacterium phragmitis]
MTSYQDLAALTPAAGEPDWQALRLAIPALRELDATPQDPVHHAEGDVWTHTRMVCERMLELPDYRNGDAERRFVLFYAALLHDIAKPPCTVTQPDGRVTSAGHSRRGAVDARVLMWRAGVPFALRERVCRLVAAHQLPFYAIRGDRSGHDAEYLARKLSWEVSLRELAALAEADMLGRVCADQRKVLDDIELFRELAREEGCLDAPRAFADEHTRIAYFRAGGGIAPDYPFYQASGSRVVMLSGLPASGKDSWTRAEGGGLPVISYDDARAELGLKHGPRAGAAVHLAVDRAKALLRSQAPFIWNATHLSERMRKKTLDLLYAYHAEVSIIYLEHGEREIKARNSRRDSTLPNQAIDRMLSHWEVPLATEAHRVEYRPAC